MKFCLSFPFSFSREKERKKERRRIFSNVEFRRKNFATLTYVCDYVRTDSALTTKVFRHQSAMFFPFFFFKNFLFMYLWRTEIFADRILECARSRTLLARNSILISTRANEHTFNMLVESISSMRMKIVWWWTRVRRNAFSNIKRITFSLIFLCMLLHFYIVLQLRKNNLIRNNYKRIRECWFQASLLWQTCTYIF